MFEIIEAYEKYILSISEITLQSTSNHIVSLTLVHKNKIDECSLSTTNKKITQVVFQIIILKPINYKLKLVVLFEC
jgi:hypothetical protein